MYFTMISNSFYLNSDTPLTKMLKIYRHSVGVFAHMYSESWLELSIWYVLSAKIVTNTSVNKLHTQYIARFFKDINSRKSGSGTVI